MKKILLLFAATMLLGIVINAQDQYTLVNRWKGTSINIEKGLDCSPVQPSWLSAVWFLEPVSGTNNYRIRNKWKGTYLNIENGLTCSDIKLSWLSAQWTFEKVEGTDFYRIRNVWKKSQFLNIENGRLSCSEILSTWFSAQWQLNNIGASNNQINQNSNNLSNNNGNNQTNQNSNNLSNDNGNNLTNQQIKEFVDRHNYYRRMVGLPDVRWSDEIADYALSWTNQLVKEGCNNIRHRSNGKYGENIAGGYGGLTPTDYVDMWGAEKQDYDGGVITRNSKAGHYTQVIWAKTTHIGCALVKCSDGKTIVICNYNPGGNYLGDSPFAR